MVHPRTMEWVLILLAAVFGLSPGSTLDLGNPPPNNTLLTLGWYVTVNCSTKLESATVSWYKKWTTFGNDTWENVCDSKRHPNVACAWTENSRNSVLNITSLEERDGGNYSCRDGNSTEYFSFGVNANASTTVHISSHPSYSMFRCRPLISLPVYSVWWKWEWRENGTTNLTKLATNDTDFKLFGEKGNYTTLHVNNTRNNRSEEGKLSACINWVEQEVEVVLCREVPLKAMYVEFAGPRGNKTAIMGDSMPPLVCRFLPRGDAALTGVRWNFQNKTGNVSTMIGSCSPSTNSQCQVSPGSRYKLQLNTVATDKSEDKAMTSTLEIVDFGERDDGNYTCEVEDEFGPGSFATVYVRGIEDFEVIVGPNRFSAVWIFVGLGITAVVLTLMVVAYLRRRKQRDVPEASSRPRVVVTETKFVQRSET